MTWVGTGSSLAGKTVQEMFQARQKWRVTWLKALARPQAAGALQVGAQVAVAQAEPVRTTQRGEALQGVKGLIRPAPAGLGVGNARQGITHRVQVGADDQAEVLEIIAAVDHYRERFRRQAARQTIGQLGAAHPTCQGYDFNAAMLRQ